MLHISEDDVLRLYPMPEAVRSMSECFDALAKGEAANQVRRRLFLPTGSVLHQLAGWYRGYYGAKVYATNVKKGAMHFHVLLYNAGTAAPLAFVEANYLGQIRTGAASGFATDLMGPKIVDTVGLIGSGFQAWTQLEAVLAVRNAREALVFSRSAEKRERFAARASERFGIPARAVATAEEAVRPAQVVITATFAKDPVIESDWVAEGAHVNAAGSNQANRREIPAGLIKRSSLIAVDSIEQARLEAGDLLLAAPQSDWPALGVKELQEFAGDPGFQRPETGVTIFESLGLGVEDVAAAAWVYEKALAEGAGKSI
jgi:ornithine cyclodeaminase/alanine dehydrogenase-like protein (mu-crystallin family)